MKTKLLLLSAISALMFVSSCSSDDDTITPSIPELEALELSNCSSGIAEGETLILENRNNGVDYIINCTYPVNGDLIIDPGVTIQFGTDATIRVYNSGSIQALGTAQNKVVFTGEDKVPGSWKGLYIISSDVKNKIEYATIEYAGAVGDDGAILLWSDTHLKMNNTNITNSQTYGLHANTNNNELLLENNTITACKAPMYLDASYVSAISNGSYTGNNTDAIIVDRGFIDEDHTWTKLNVPYHFPNGVDVIAGGNLTVMPGVIMKFGQDSRLFINEGASGPKPSIIAVGTAAEPIVFTSIDNVMSAWRGIYFDSPNALNEIGFATIENASNPDQEGAIETWYGTVLNVHDVSFKDIQNCAIHQYKFPADPDTLTSSNLTYINVAHTFCQN
ncbi:hypothetical protein [Bizionia sp.]|uniref:hypothetical protein n=1 Tax=Bizionia sp. TaxID=1954480 RepID=UPI003A923653